MRLVVIVGGDEESESLVLSVMVSVINFMTTFLLENQIHKNAKSFSSLYTKRQKIFYKTYPKLKSLVFASLCK